MTESVDIPVKVLYEASCPTCGTKFINQNRVKAVQEAERCFAAGIAEPFIADVGDIVQKRDWNRMDSARNKGYVEVRIVRRYYAPPSLVYPIHIPQYEGVLAHGHNPGRAVYLFAHGDIKTANSASDS